MAAEKTPPKPLRQLKPEQTSARIIKTKIWRRMNIENQHFMGCIVGREGTGKSHSGLTLCSAVDRGFSADDVFFQPEELLQAFDSSEYGQGDMIMLDEAGVGLGNRSWYDKEQILLNQTLQTVRDDNMGVIFTLPRLEELDKQTIGRLHAFIEMMNVYPDRGYGMSKWKNIQMTRDGRDGTFKPYPQMSVNGVDKRITRFKIRAPPESLVSEYEQSKESFKDQLYQEAIAAYDDDEGSGKGPQEIADEIIDNDASGLLSEHSQRGTQYLDKDMIRVEYDLTHRDASAVKKLVEKETDINEIIAGDTHTP